MVIRLQSDPEQKPRNILPDCIIPALALAFTVYYLTTITEVPWISQASAIVVSGLLTLSIAAYVIRSVWRLRAGREVLRFEGTGHSLVGPRRTALRRLGLLAMAIGYVWFIDSLGFIVTTFVFVIAAILLLSSLANWKRALALALSCSIIGYVVFIYFFKTRFPAGPIEIWLQGVL